MKDEYFRTYDLGLAAALDCLGHRLDSVEKENPKRSTFVFILDKKIERDIESYWDNTLKVLAQAHFNSIKMLKNRIYSQ